ncbi:MAG: urease subunit beta [Natronomonas sp.]
MGMRLNVPAGTAVRFEPGGTTTVELVALGGKRRMNGLNGLTNGSVENRDRVLRRGREGGFKNAGEGDGE